MVLLVPRAYAHKRHCNTSRRHSKSPAALEGAQLALFLDWLGFRHQSAVMDVEPGMLVMVWPRALSRFLPPHFVAHPLVMLTGAAVLCECHRCIHCVATKT